MFLQDDPVLVQALAAATAEGVSSHQIVPTDIV